MKKQAPGSEALVYRPANVAWGTAEFIAAAPSATSRAFLYGVLIFLVAGFLYAGLTKVAISIEARGKLVTREAVLAIRSPFSMTIAKLGVKEGQRVTRGELLVEAEDRVSNEEYDLVAGQKAHLLEVVAKQKAGPCPECLGALKAMSEAAFKINNKGGVRTSLAEARQLMLDYIGAFEKYDGYQAVTVSLRRRITIADGKLKEIRKRDAETLLAMQVEALTNEIVQAQTELTQTRQTLEGQLSTARNRLEVRLGGLLEAVDLYRTQNVIVAPISGVVATLKVIGAGQLVAAGEPLLELIPLDSGLIAELYVANRDISRVDPQMKVRVRLDALPEREYGSVEGTVASVPTNVVATGDPSVALTYRVTAALPTQSLQKGGVDYPFRLGMTLSGIVITRYESLLVVGLRKVFNLKDEFLSE